MKQKLLFICLLLTCIVAFPRMANAQNARDRWNFSDYYPKNYFFSCDQEHQEYNDCIGEAIFYMRNAGVAPLRDLPLEKNDTILRLSYFTKFAHPLFIQVTNHNGYAFLTWQKAKSISGHIEHSTYMSLGDNGWEDVTENEYYGNDWTPGMLDSNARQMFPVEWSKIRKFLRDNDFIHSERAQCCTGFEAPYLLEYRDKKKQNTHYSQCYFDAQELELVRWLVSLADPDYVDMDIHKDARYTKDEKFFIPPQFPGGEDSIQHFLQAAVQYPTEALQHLEEFKVCLSLIVEKDGTISLIHNDSWPSDNNEFVKEVVRAAKTMPRWKPATKEWKPIRCYTYIVYQFVLPDSLRPIYGQPIIETRRDAERWKKIEECHRKLLINPQDVDALCWMGKYYYWDFILENSPVAEPTFRDSIQYENRWENFFDHSPVVANPGDSALKYFYQVWRMSKDTTTLLKYLDLYMPILQLEYCLQLPHNPSVKLPFDTSPGAYFPSSYFVNWPENDVWDSATDYLSDINRVGIWSSYWWVDCLSEQLSVMEEPVLYDYPIEADEEIYRCSFFPSFHPSVSFRMHKIGEKIELHWFVLKPHYKKNANTDLGYEVTYSRKQGKKRIYSSKYKEFVDLIDVVEQAKLPHSYWICMTDGYQLVYERKTGQGYEAHLTNEAYSCLGKVLNWLVKGSGLKLPYIDDYM